MLKKRIIFTLIYENNNFMLSRNFRLQRVGNKRWLDKNYNFTNTAKSIDELIILDASRGERNSEQFCETVKSITENIFIPVALGGGINSLEDAKAYMNSGADKLVINSALLKNPDLIKELIELYGAQCIIASIDFKNDDGECIVYIDNGSTPIQYSLEEYLNYVEGLGVGEIYLNSIKKDGTGQGYELDFLDPLLQSRRIPVIISGGAGNYTHFLQGLQYKTVDAVATANLFNFVGDGLKKARESLTENNIKLPNW